MSKVKVITSHLFEEIERSLETASTIYILSAFVMNSGVRLLKDSLKKAADRGADIKVLTGDYLYITQPEALSEMASIHENIQIRLFQSNGVSFHAKAYLFQHLEGGAIFVGSSNLSLSAFTTGIEWNLGVFEQELQTIEVAMDRFMELFHHEQTLTINQETIKEYQKNYQEFHMKYPELEKKWTDSEEQAVMLPEIRVEKVETVKESSVEYNVRSPITPRPAQQEALAALQEAMEEDYKKAMVVMATGLGKTYLAAFFAEQFQRVLFIAHREEILIQAKQSFEKVISNRSFGLYYGKEKYKRADILFGSVHTMGMKHHYDKFPPNHFDLIIIDEFHHAAANSYQRILDYFEPSFLLGITATPDRMDGKDVFAICDGNVAYQRHFIDAIEQNCLSPFKYYGVYDEIDYSKITWLGTKYAKEELIEAQLKEQTAQKILESWQKYKQTRTLVFCSSIEQAKFLSNYFNQQGYQTIDLHSKQVGISRSDAIQKLEAGQLDAIFTVDLFNEGVDIPAVDTLLFVRPTESLTVFTQQVGRGLRLTDGKEHCVIIDLIGNYRNADIKLRLFDTRMKQGKGKKENVVPSVPIGCELNLDLRVIDLLKELARKRQPRKEKLYQGYLEVKRELGRRPSYLELHLKANVNVAEIRQEWGSYAGFLYWAEELVDKEQEVFKQYKEWLQLVEENRMTKSYKMVVLKTMLNKGKRGWYEPITSAEVAPYFSEFYLSKKHRLQIEFSKEKSKGAWLKDLKEVAKKVAQMPMTMFSNSSKGLITFEDNLFKVNFDVQKEAEEDLYNFTKEICEYRLHEYFEKKAVD